MGTPKNRVGHVMHIAKTIRISDAPWVLLYSVLVTLLLVSWAVVPA